MQTDFEGQKIFSKSVKKNAQLLRRIETAKNRSFSFGDKLVFRVNEIASSRSDCTCHATIVVRALLLLP